VLLKDGKIFKVAPSIESQGAAKIIDATNKFVIPGGVETHTHL
jgi:dihydropyrimidinase